uniref:FTH domain-containing protein n=1 Tax=Steinernema glaseri TaxID=37863 RepID=A0A1I8A285_9BILA
MFSKIADFLHPKDKSERVFDLGIRVTIAENGADLSVRAVKILVSSVDDNYAISKIFESPFHVWRPREDDLQLIHEAYVEFEHHSKGVLSIDGPKPLVAPKMLEEAFKVVSGAKSICLKIDVNDCSDLLRELLKMIPVVPCSELYLKHIVDVEDYQVFEQLVKRLKISGLSLLKPYSLSTEIIRPIVDLYLYQTTEKWTLKKLEFYSNKPFKNLESILTTSEKPSVMAIEQRTVSIQFE